MHLVIVGLFVLQSVARGTSAQADTSRPGPAAVGRDAIRRAQRDAREARRDSIRAHRDSLRAAQPPKRRAVTAAYLATAFHTAAARTLLERARVARLAHDSTLTGYDAKVVLRLSVGLGFRRFGRDRLLFRHEEAARVRWQRDRGAWVDVTGLRTAVPSFSDDKDAKREMQGGMDDMVDLPYYPGSEALWVGSGLAKREVDEREVVHPLADGAEAYYRYAIGDSMLYRLPDGKEIRLIEMRATAREPRWNLIVGSFWFDAATAQLVRAAYRLAVPMDIVQVAAQDPDEDNDIPRWLRPMTATVKGITVEYGLHKERWWLPRVEAAEGEAQVSFMRVPFRIEESFRYASVNGTDTLPTFPAVAARDSAAGDSAARDAGTSRHRRDVVDVGDATVRVATRYEGAVRVATRVPKDTAALERSPDLPPSVYDAGEALFSHADADRLMKELDLGLQAGWAPQRPTFHYGIEQGLVRYNRVEGLSAGVAADEVLGQGYTASALARIGTADLQPNGELGLRRSDERHTIGVAAYRRLVAANDWGDPLTFGASVNALVFGRDEGLYYRAWGAELTVTDESASSLRTLRLFAERQSNARVETQWSLARLLEDARFPGNIASERVGIVGLAGRLRSSYGVDPHGFRLLTDLRGEGAVGGVDYARGAVDATLSHGLGPQLDGALMLSTGTSAGQVPVQRFWYLGGTQTIRGQPIAVASGDAFWMAHAELGTSSVGARPVVFYDLGWAGRRDEWQHPGQPVSGAGVGASFLDGLVRLDLAKGIHPARGVRAYLYLEGRF